MTGSIDNDAHEKTLQKHSFQRWYLAFKNTFNGFKYGYSTQAAIREEAFAIVLAIPIAGLISDSFSEFSLLLLSVVFVLLVEVLNTAIEITLDRVSLEHHSLTGAAKDLGSLAVFLSIAIAVVIWINILLN